MSARPETIALLDRMFGTDRQICDQLDRLEMAEVDYRSIVEELSRVAYALLDSEPDSEEGQQAVLDMNSTLKWAETMSNEQSRVLLDAADAISLLCGVIR